MWLCNFTINSCCIVERGWHVCLSNEKEVNVLGFLNSVFQKRILIMYMNIFFSFIFINRIHYIFFPRCSLKTRLMMQNTVVTSMALEHPLWMAIHQRHTRTMVTHQTPHPIHSASGDPSTPAMCTDFLCLAENFADMPKSYWHNQLNEWRVT